MECVSDMIDFKGLNQPQLEAVQSTEQYLRIIAGAGSGKTRVLTMRIAHLIEDQQVHASKILAITFTNKAANEMKERILKLLDHPMESPWISTIHSLCVRILREDIGALNYPRNFTILDAEDQKAIVKEAYKKLEIDSNTVSYGQMLSYISNCKCADIPPLRAKAIASGNHHEDEKAAVYQYYVDRQEALFALDFDDLILWTVRLFSKFDVILGKWQRRFHYILVDEFQDIDKIQFKLIQQLAGDVNHLLVVGDPDQTIYTWRGADVNIIMQFERSYPKAKTIILNQNYRSNDMILNASNALIAHNKHRVKKDLFTSRKSHQKIMHYAAPTEEYQAMWVASQIKSLHQNEQKSYHDIAILYRSNYLSRSLEKALLDERIPYIIYGGVRFFERQEVKDALSYLRLITTGDDLAFSRIINRPKRGIGNKSMDTIGRYADEHHLTMYEAIQNQSLLTPKLNHTLEQFVTMVEKWKQIEREKQMSLFDLFEKVLDDSGYIAMLKEEKETDRLENLKELIDDLKEFTQNYPESTLDEYLQLVSLYGDREETSNTEFVQLMTIHASKGLEFDTVFVTDLNEGIFPNERAMNDDYRGVEEERRLAYVAFTRAKNRLFVTEAGGFSYLLQKVRSTSRFIEELDQDCLEHHGIIERKTQPIHLLQDDEGDVIVRQPLAQSAGVKKGQKVSHPKFGEGIVIQVENKVAKIAFAYPHGVKSILATFPGLKVIGKATN